MQHSLNEQVPGSGSPPEITRDWPYASRRSRWTLQDIADLVEQPPCRAEEPRFVTAAVSPGLAEELSHPPYLPKWWVVQ